ncbi:YHYH protein [Vibrio amylolyticus]|uniref:YHYH protein n=1 Tax=Vibrio amylolyticus TaxID=2847292 RepID=UPI00354CE203
MSVLSKKWIGVSALVAATLMSGCNSGEGEAPVETGTTSTDITNRHFTNTSGDCEQYLGSFRSSANDIKRSLLFTGSTDVSSSGSECIIQSNAIPNHDFNDSSASFATNVSEQSLSYQFTRAPINTASNTALSLGTSEAILLNGVKIDLLAAACYNVGGQALGEEKIGCGQDEINHPWRYDPMSPLNGFGTDGHNAHVQPTGEYHYHGNPIALFIQDCTGGEASPVIGFAADGFPVYGSCFYDSATSTVRKATSSYQIKSGARQTVSGYTTPTAGTGSVVSNNYDGQFRGDWEYVVALGDLDECNGMTVNGQYGYYVTDTFPWVLNCFVGSVHSSFSASLEQRSHTHD